MLYAVIVKINCDKLFISAIYIQVLRKLINCSEDDYRGSAELK